MSLDFELVLCTGVSLVCDTRFAVNVAVMLHREHGMPDDITTHGVLSGIFNSTASIG